MKNNFTKLLALALAFCMVISLAACGKEPTSATLGAVQQLLSQGSNAPSLEGQELLGAQPLGGNLLQTANPTVLQETAKEEPKQEQASSPSTQQDSLVEPKGDYNQGVVLVKCKEEFSSALLGDLAYLTAEPLYKGSKWYVVELADKTQTQEAVSNLTALETFEKVDYDYIMGVTGPKEDAEKNPNYDDQVNLGLSNIPHGWTVNGKAPGGSPDVVVAVIDTGVDYNHLDLRNNIWVNVAEIPDNGKDDDGNGYVDDIYGWNCVGDNNNPMDDNGHGTHVAGIVAAENNKEGGIGVAYNSKVMVLKAGNSSGYFNNSDIAEAIQYAYMNGASVINMSFGGSSISIAVEEALENAYNTCVLVAAAGNSGACNNLACLTCDIKSVSYPAALPYVIGVMSTEKDGKHLSSFSNYDHNPYDTIEYEVYAVGEGVGSTWPSNKYACLNGTSMAAPTVSGIAALLRSYYTDRELYSTKFIQSQIVNTGTVHPHVIFNGEHVTDEAHSVADVVEALTKLPKPAVNLYDYRVDDSTAIHSNNNGNGVVDAGETVRLYLSLHNRGGVASNVSVSIDTYRSTVGDETLTDPYFTLTNPTMTLSDIGTYSVRESGEKYFEIVVSADCPNDYLADFNIRFTYTNGMDEKDTTLYTDDGKQKAQFTVSRGYLLPATITEDTVYKADKLYIVGQDVVIAAGVTVTFEEGCQIQFYDDREYYNSPRIINYGTLLFKGSQEQMINIFPSAKRVGMSCCITVINGSGVCNLNYVNSVNLTVVSAVDITNSIMRVQYGNDGNISCYDSGVVKKIGVGTNHTGIYADRIINCYAEVVYYLAANYFEGNYIYQNSAKAIYTEMRSSGEQTAFINNIWLTEAKNEKFNTAYGLILKAEKLVDNNKFISIDNNNMDHLIRMNFNGATVKNSYFSPLYQQYASQNINGYYDSTGTPTIDVYGSCSDTSLLYPHVVAIELFNQDGEAVTTIGKEEIKVRVTFNRPMDTAKETFLTFGTIKPYADYRINGSYVSDTVWEGTYTLKAQIENGQNFLKVNNACAAEDPTKVVFGEYQLHEFTIDTTAVLAMNLQAVAKNQGIELTWAQDEYDTLLGYNIYRSEEKDGNFVKLNPSILLATDESFLDTNAEPGKTYWYTYTVVLSDFTESAPAGKMMATALDTMAPSLYHTPVNQGYLNNNLVISCTASDNVGIETVTLYYRTKGETVWKKLGMAKTNDKYSATVFGSELALEGLEYYIVATDGVNTIAKGSETEPYSVVIKSDATLTKMGDVDGNGAVTTKDALMLMQCLEGNLLLADDQFKRADLNGDAVLSAAEALRILQYVNGNVNTLEM